MKLLLASVLILCAAPLLPAADPGNLVVNGDFTQPLEPKAATGWNTRGTVVDATPALGKAVRLVCLGKGAGVCRQDIPMAPGTKTVKISLKVRQGDVKGAPYEVIICQLDADKKPLKADGSPASSTGAGESWVAHAYEDKVSPTWKTLRFDGKLTKKAVFLQIILLAGPRAGSVDFTEVECESRN